MSGGYFMGPPARRRRRRTPGLLFLALLLVAAAAVVAVVALSRDRVDRRGADVESLEVDSKLVDRSLEQKVAVPAGGGEGRPLLVFLHGRGSKPDSAFTDGFFAELDRLGDRAPVVLAVNGGKSSYYHDRDGGRWGSYVTREAIPAAVERYGVDRERIAIGGTSMGGFGALDIARRDPGRYCAVGAHSAALWRRAGDTAPGAFDDARDFRRHDVYRYVRTERRAFARERLWMDVGRADPFRSVDADVAGMLKRRDRDISWHLWPGGHGGEYFDRHVDDYLRWYARELELCR